MLLVKYLLTFKISSYSQPYIYINKKHSVSSYLTQGQKLGNDKGMQ